MFFKKLLIIFFIFSFLTTNSHLELYSMPIVFPNFYINSKIGEVVDKFDGNNNQKVICIEDLHCNPEVQANIAEIIKDAKDIYKEKLTFIGVEGSVGEVNVNIFSKIPNKKIKEKVVNKYLQKGYLSGAELYAIKYDENMRIFGLENSDLYEKNFGLLYRSFLFYDQWQKILDRLDREMELANELLATDDLKKFKELKKDNLDKYIKALVGLSKDKIKVSREYKYLQIFIKLSELKSQKNQSLLNKELTIVREKLSDYLDEEQIEKIKDQDYLYKIIKIKKVTVPMDFVETQKFLAYKEYEAQFDKVLFLEELENFEQQIRILLSGNRKQLVRLVDSKNLLDLMRRYFTNTASIHDVKEWQENREILYRNMRELGELLEHNNKFIKEEKLLRHIDKNMDDFYRYAEKRNEAILENLFKNSQDSVVKIVIFGGYHTEGMIEFLRAKSISFEIIRPSINQKINKNLYFDRLRKQMKSNKELAKEFGIETLMVISALQNPLFNTEVFQSVIDEAVIVLPKEDLLKLINGYARKVNVPEIIWQGEIQGRPEEIYRQNGVFKIRQRQDVALDFVYFEGQDGVLTARQLEQKLGMLDRYVSDIAEMVAANNVISGFRPISRDATEAFKKGASGKGLNIKGKSSSYGLSLRGKIPFAQKWSKLLGKESEILRYDEFNKYAIAHYSTVGKTPLLDEEGREVFGVIGKDGRPILKDNHPIFVVKSLDNKFYYEGTTEEALGLLVEKIEVIGYKKGNNVLPCVADYDQLCFGAQLDKTADTFANSDLTNDKYGDSGVRGFYTQIGYSATVGLSTITEDTNAISHGQEAHNTFPERLDSFSRDSSDGYLFFLPRYIGGILQKGKMEIRLLKNEDEILALYNEFLALGYQMPVNIKWGWRKNAQGKYEKYPNRIIDKDLLDAKSKVDLVARGELLMSMQSVYAAILSLNTRGKLAQVLEKEKELAKLEAAYFVKYNERSPYELARGFALDESIAIQGVSSLLSVGQHIFTSSRASEAEALDPVLIDQIKNILSNKSEKIVFVSIAECVDGDIENHLAKMGVLEGGNIRQDFQVKLVNDIANPTNATQFNLALKKISELSKKSGGRIEWLVGKSALKMIKNAENKTLTQMVQQGIVKVAYRNIGAAREISGKFVPAGTVITSGGFIGEATLAAIKASENKVDEAAIAQIFNVVLNFAARVYGANLGDLSAFEKALTEDETWASRANQLTVDISAFNLSKEDFVKLMSMTRFIWGDTGILSDVEAASGDKYGWFRQLALGVGDTLPDVISKYSIASRSDQVLKITTEMADGRVLQQNMNVTYAETGEQNLEVADVLLKSAALVDLEGVDNALVRKLQRQVKIEKIIDEVLDITGVKKLIDLFRKDRRAESVTVEDYKNVASAA